MKITDHINKNRSMRFWDIISKLATNKLHSIVSRQRERIPIDALFFTIDDYMRSWPPRRMIEPRECDEAYKMKFIFNISQLEEAFKLLSDKNVIL